MPNVRFRLLNIEKRIIRMQSHLDFLQNCKQAGQFPQGLALHKTPVVNMDLFPSEFLYPWLGTLNAASLLLTDHLITFYPSAIREAETRREALSNEFIDFYGLQEFLRFSKDIQNSLARLRSNLQNDKRHKLSKFKKLDSDVGDRPRRDWWSENVFDYPVEFNTVERPHDHVPSKACDSSIVLSPSQLPAPPPTYPEVSVPPDSPTQPRPTPESLLSLDPPPKTIPGTRTGMGVPSSTPCPTNLIMTEPLILSETGTEEGYLAPTKEPIRLRSDQLFGPVFIGD
jgi:hypothetical protein